MASSIPLRPGGGPLLELPPFFRRLNAEARRRALVRSILVSRLQASLRASAAPKWHPDAYVQPGEIE